MCGIMGYVGQKPAANILLEGLKRLEYRGYDSAGIAICNDGHVEVARAKGKIIELEQKMNGTKLPGTRGIGHTRWATHGKPSDENAHPHRSEHVVVVHNGIIENHLSLRKKLLEAGFAFQSETDTEIIPFLIESYLQKNLSFEQAVRKSLAEIEGTFALTMMCSKEPDKIIAAKNSSPLILGIGVNENLVASDIPALLSHTRDVVVLDDGEMAVITQEGYEITDFLGKKVNRKPRQISWSRQVAEKEGYKHFMLKEIHEQPRVIVDTLRGRVVQTRDEVILDDVTLTDSEIERVERVQLVACGTSWHAAHVGKFWLEGIAKLPTDVDLSSEYRYREPIVSENVLFIPISQSGETADTLAALEEAKRFGANILSICNVIDSSIARKSNHVFYTRAGPEISVASTKAFTTQLTSLLILSLYLGQRRKKITREELRKHLQTLNTLPVALEKALREEKNVEKVAHQFCRSRDFLFIGRGSSFPIALEGALKLKEISYIHAEGYPGGELKHGPIALIDEKMPVVALASGGPTYVKMLSNIQEVNARGGRIIAVVNEADHALDDIAEATIRIPNVDHLIRPIVESIPMQLLAYHAADACGTDVDQPRNLAKSVTVE
jgi:glutamine---fructose-6-phosphate transaminase (isomerizing)